MRCLSSDGKRYESGYDENGLSITYQKPFLLGDVNQDKKVSIADANRLRRYLAKLCSLDGSAYAATAPDAADVKRCDVTGDGKITIADATRIQRYLAKLCNLDGSKPYRG